METVSNTINDWYVQLMAGTWAWFTSLTREEWVVVLGVACACGFLCMRGFGSRSNY